MLPTSTGHGPVGPKQCHEGALWIQSSES